MNRRNCYLLSLLSFFYFFNNEAKAGGPQGYVQSNIFYTEDDSAYTETSINILASTVRFVKKEDQKFHGALQITILYMDDSTVFQYQKYVLNAAERDDTMDMNYNLTDLKLAFVPAGKHTVEVSILDLNNPAAKELVMSEVINVAFPSAKILFSSIEFVSSYEKTITPNRFSKNGYDIQPLGINFIPNSSNQLIFYVEFYHALKIVGDSSLIISYSIKNQNGKMMKGMSSLSAQKANTVNIIFSNFDITELPSGNYDLYIEIRNQRNKVLASDFAFFQRMKKLDILAVDDLNKINPANDFISALKADSLGYYLASLRPIASQYEEDFIRTVTDRNDTMLMKKYMYFFWQSRDPLHAYSSWIDYKYAVDFCEEHFSGINLNGFNSDRGRVFLQYGIPDFTSGIVHEAGAHPYDVWEYYKLDDGGQTNVHFVFYDPGKGFNDFRLIYSDAIGEIKDDRWKMKIYETWGGSSNLDQTNTNDYMGKKIDDYFKK